MDGASVLRSFSNALSTVGKSVLSAQFPNDFEYYMMALELTDSEGEMIDFLSFPVMPESISKNELNRTNVKKSNRGTTILTSPSPTPSEISIKGNFGRYFKFLLSQRDNLSASGYAFSFQGGKKDLFDISDRALTVRTPDFSAGVKTGFGVIKILQAILNKSSGVGANGKPFRLYLYNLALGESYLVVVPPNGYTISQNVQKNMIWEYAVSFTIIAPMEAIQSQYKPSSLSDILSRAGIQKTVYSVGKQIANLL